MPPVPARRVLLPLALALLAAAGSAAAGAAAHAQRSGPQPSQASHSPPSVPEPSGLPGTVPAQALCATASRESPVAVEVRGLAPRAPRREDEPFQVHGRLVNCGTESLSRMQVRLSVGARIATRSQLRLAADEPLVGFRRLPAQDAATDVLPPGASTTFDVRVLVGDLRLGQRNGVHPLSVQARARTGVSGSRGPVGLASTFVPWFPEGPVAPTRVAWVVPLVDEPHRGPDEVLLDDRLDALLESDPARRGRLARALTAGRAGARGACDDRAAAPEGAVPPPAADPCRGDPVPVTYAVDPELVSAVESMTRPYPRRQGRQRVEQPASANARWWLAAVRAAADEADVLALPYGDPDVVALSRTDSPLKDDVELLGRLGQSEARRLLASPSLTSVAWPPPGPVAPVVDPLAAGEGTALLLDESVLEPHPPSGRTPSARKSLPSTLEPVTALVADEALSRLVEPDVSAPGWQGERLAEQRWIAETAVIAAERPGQSRTLVVAPRRQADLVPSVAAGAIADTGRLPWLCGVPLADAAAGVERCSTVPDTQGPAAVDGEAVLRDSVPDVRPLPPSFVSDIAEVRRAADQFTEQVLVSGTDSAKDTKARLLRARGRTASTAWRTAPAQGHRLLELLQADVEGLRSRIALVGRPALLTGRAGTIQLVVENGLDQPVNVGVRLDPTSAARLTSEDTEIQVVPGRSSQQVSVRVEARTSGRFTARAALVDASGRPFGQSVVLDVRSTQYGRVALAVTGVAAAVLLVAAGVRITRRAVRRP